MLGVIANWYIQFDILFKVIDLSTFLEISIFQLWIVIMAHRLTQLASSLSRFAGLLKQYNYHGILISRQYYQHQQLSLRQYHSLRTLSRPQLANKPFSLNIQHQAQYATHKEKANGNTNTNSSSGSGPGPSPSPSKASIFWHKLKSGSSFFLTTLLVLGSVGLTGLALYAIGKELFSSSGDTKLFNRSINLIQNNLYCQKLLRCAHGNEKLAAYGEDYTLGNRNGWGNRNRPIASARRIDKKTGNTHLYMKYHVESSQKKGSVQLEAVNYANSKQTEIKTLLLTVDKEPFYVVAPPKKSILPFGRGSGGANGTSSGVRGGNGGGFLGIKWGTSKD